MAYITISPGTIPTGLYKNTPTPKTKMLNQRRGLMIRWYYFSDSYKGYKDSVKKSTNTYQLRRNISPNRMD